MKKFAKILTVILTVCLFAGVIMTTVASAATNDFLKPSSTSNVIAYDFETGGAGNDGSINQNCQMFVQNLSDGNYADKAVRSYTDSSGNTNKYFSIFHENRDSRLTLPITSSVPVPSFSFSSSITPSSVDYFVIDFDISTDSIYYNDGGSKGVNYIGFGIYPGASAYSYLASIVTDDHQTFSLSAGEGKVGNVLPLSSEAGVWNHITIVVKSNYSGDTYSNSTSYTYLNGEFVGSRSINLTGKTPDRLGIRFDSLNYIGVAAADRKAEFSLNIDNVAVNTYAKGYGNSGVDYSIADYFASLDTSKPIYKCEDVVYNYLDYTYTAAPAGQVVATVKAAGAEEGTDYYFVDKALTAITDGATITTKKSINNFAIPEGINELTVVCTNGATFTYTGAYTHTENTADGTTTYVVTPAASSIKAYWLAADGTTITSVDAVVGNNLEVPEEVTTALSGINGTAAYQWKTSADGSFESFVPGTAVPDGATEITVKPHAVKVTWKGAETVSDVEEYWYVGSTITARSLSEFDAFKEVGVDGWYNIEYAKWDGFVENATASADVVYTPVKEPVAALNKCKANITFLDKYSINMYLKKDATISGVTASGGVLSTKTLSDGEYYCVTSEESIGYHDRTPSLAPTINFTVGYNGNSYPLTATAKVTLEGYVKTAIGTNGLYDHGTVEAKLIYNFINYIRACFANNGSTDYTWLPSVLEQHADCACHSSTAPKADNSLDTSKLSDYMISYYPVLRSPYNLINRVGIALLVPQNSDDVEEVNVTFKGIKDNKTNQLIEVGFTKSTSTYTDTEKGVTYNVYVSNEGDLAIYNMNETITITVTKNDESTADGTYRLSEYVVNNSDVDYTNALYYFAEAAKAFKMDGATEATE